MELMFFDQNLFKLQLAFPHLDEGLSTETPGLAIGPEVGAFFYNNFENTPYSVPCLSYVASFIFIHRSIS
jgi:hypothetical protein